MAAAAMAARRWRPCSIPRASCSTWLRRSALHGGILGGIARQRHDAIERDRIAALHRAMRAERDRLDLDRQPIGHRLADGDDDVGLPLVQLATVGVAVVDLLAELLQA